MTKTGIALAFMLLFGMGLGSHGMAQTVTCSTFGAYTTCSDGSSANRFGNTTTYTPPPMPSGQPFRPQTTCTRFGNTTTCY